MIERYLILFLLILIIISCNKREKRYEFYDIEEEIIESEGEYLDGVLDGSSVFYFKDGTKMETSKWKKGVRDGLTVAFYPNGKVAGEYSYVMGKARGEFKIYYESGVLKQISCVNESFYNTKNYDETGKLLEMTPYFTMNSDTLFLGDTLTIAGTLENVEDPRFFNGKMIIANQFANKGKDFLMDTIAIKESTINYYRASFVPNKRGTYQFVAQLVYQFKTDRMFKNFPIDSIAFFSTEARVFVK